MHTSLGNASMGIIHAEGAPGQVLLFCIELDTNARTLKMNKLLARYIVPMPGLPAGLLAVGP